MEKQAENALSSLRRVARQADGLLSRLSGASDRMSTKSSSSLFGTAGGILGLLAGTLLSNYIGMAALLICTPLTALGLIGGVLWHRGVRRIRLERRLAEHRFACDEILDRIKFLPESAPTEVREELWETYRLLNSSFSTQATLLLAPRQSEARGLLLPGKEESSQQEESDN